MFSQTSTENRTSGIKLINGQRAQGSSCLSKKEESVSKKMEDDVISIWRTGLGGEIPMALHDESPQNYVIGINQTSKW